IRMALCRRTTESEPLESHEANSRDLHRIRCVQQRLETARIQLRGFHRYLCTHAGSRDGERSPRRLLPISGSRCSLASKRPFCNRLPFRQWVERIEFSLTNKSSESICRRRLIQL